MGVFYSEQCFTPIWGFFIKEKDQNKEGGFFTITHILHMFLRKH